MEIKLLHILFLFSINTIGQGDRQIRDHSGILNINANGIVRVARFWFEELGQDINKRITRFFDWIVILSN